MTEAQRQAEIRRQAELDGLRLDEGNETAYDDLTRLAANLCKVPIAMIVIADSSRRQWFKSGIGVTASEAPVEFTFSSHAVQHPGEITLIEDATQDARFVDNPFVRGPTRVRFFLGIPLVTSKGHAIGTLCLLDQKPRTVFPEQLEELVFMARQIVLTMEKRRDEIE